MLVYFLFAVGLILLLKGASLLVDGAASLARRLRVSSLVIGLTIVGMGTSAPEFFVNILSNLEGVPLMGIGNILGANIADIFLILGTASLIHPLFVRKGVIWQDIPYSLLATFILGILVNDALISSAPSSILDRIDGLVLVSFFFIFLYHTLSSAKDGVRHIKEYTRETTVGAALVRVVVGIALLAAGANWVVQGGVAIAHLLGVGEAIIGLTLVSLGTTLPELATSIIAARRRESDIAVGNAVGSTIFNIFWVLGVSAIVRPLPYDAALNPSVGVNIFASVLLFGTLFVGKRHVLERWQGALLLLIYLGYLLWITVGNQL